jgi:hypothetical protein
MKKILLIILGTFIIFSSMAGFYLYQSYGEYQKYRNNLTKQQKKPARLIIDDNFELNQNKQIVDFSKEDSSNLSTQDETSQPAIENPPETQNSTPTSPLPPINSQGLTEAEYQKLVEEFYKTYNTPLTSQELINVDVEDFSYHPSPLPEISPYIPTGPSQEYCNSQKSYLDSHNQYLISSENSRYQDEKNQMEGTLMNNGTYGSGAGSRVIAQIDIKHQNNLDSINASYNSQIADLKNQGCSF